ncbi:hypothetical protein [Halalkalicoccus salilacus]
MTNLSVELATWAGVSVSLEPRLTLPVLRILVPMLATLVVVGGLAGVIAARPAATTSPTALRSHAGTSSLPAVVQRIETHLPPSFSPRYWSGGRSSRRRRRFPCSSSSFC